MAYEFESHRPHFFPGTRYAVVAQLVERHLAKVEVASPSLVYRSILFCGCSSMAELQPSKLATRVRFPSPAPSAIHRTRGFAVVAQLVERHLAKVEVASPSLVYRSSKSRRWTALFRFTGAQ